MDGLTYVIDQLGRALAQAEQTITQLREQLEGHSHDEAPDKPARPPTK